MDCIECHWSGDSDAIFQAENVARQRVSIANRTHWKLEHRVGPQAAGEPPRAHIGPRLDHPVLSVEIDKVDRKSHPEGMDRLARNDPQTFAVSQRLPSEQALATVPPVSREFHPVG